jgi:hypothetical protein
MNLVIYIVLLFFYMEGRSQKNTVPSNYYHSRTLFQALIRTNQVFNVSVRTVASYSGLKMKARTSS